MAGIDVHDPGIRVHDPGIDVHDRPESVFTMVRNTQSRRYERRSLVLTTNLAFSEWPTIFPNATCATALIDRVIHHADVIAVEGKSYRLREAAEAAKRARKGKAGK